MQQFTAQLKTDEFSGLLLLRKHILSEPVGEYSRALMQNLRWLEAKLFPHVPFIHTWNVKT